MDYVTQLEVLTQVGIAAILGAVIGLEREMAGKPAGLRTHILVCSAAAMLVGLGAMMVQLYGPEGVGRADPIRIVQAIVTGISFIGAGTILFDQGAKRVEGVTTAASILMSTVIGIAVGLWQLLLAGVVTLAMVAVLGGLGRVERMLESRRKHR